MSAAIAGTGPSGEKRRARELAAIPFRKSRAKAASPAAVPALRITLVAPTFPLPTWRTSTPRRLATR